MTQFTLKAAVCLVASIPLALAYTHYIDETEVIVVQSVHPCHIYGDPDLYGVGVRVGFYIQFAAGLIAILANLEESIKSLRLGFSILFFSVLVNLWLGHSEGGFTLLEWFIVSPIISLLPLVALPFPLTVKSHWKVTSDVSAAGDTTAGLANTANTGSQRSLNDDEVNDQENAGSPVIGLNKKPTCEDPLGIAFLFTLFLMYYLCQPWLVFTAADAGHKSSCTARVLFFFVPVNLYGKHWLRVIRAITLLGMIVASPLCLFFAVILTLFGTFAREEAKEYLFKKEKNEFSPKKAEKELGMLEKLAKKNPAAKPETQGPNTNEQPTPEEELKATQHRQDLVKGQGRADALKKYHKEYDDVKTILRRIRVVWCLFNLVFGTSSIIFIERTIRINHIDLGTPISKSTGQRLPIVIGVLTASATAFEGFFKFLDWRSQRKSYEENKNRVVGALERAKNQIEKQLEEMTESRAAALRKSRAESAQWRSTSGGGPSILGRSWGSPWSRHPTGKTPTDIAVVGG